MSVTKNILYMLTVIVVSVCMLSMYQKIEVLTYHNSKSIPSSSLIPGFMVWKDTHNIGVFANSENSRYLRSSFSLHRTEITVAPEETKVKKRKRRNAMSAVPSGIPLEALEKVKLELEDLEKTVNKQAKDIDTASNSNIIVPPDLQKSHDLMDENSKSTFHSIASSTQAPAIPNSGVMNSLFNTRTDSSKDNANQGIQYVTNSGNQPGYAAGHNLNMGNAGYPNGYPNGYSNGYSNGYPNGYSNGYPNGYPNGYNPGYNQGNGYAGNQNSGGSTKSEMSSPGNSNKSGDSNLVSNEKKPEEVKEKEEVKVKEEKEEEVEVKEEVKKEVEVKKEEKKEEKEEEVKVKEVKEVKKEEEEEGVKKEDDKEVVIDPDDPNYKYFIKPSVIKGFFSLVYVGTGYSDKRKPTNSYPDASTATDVTAVVSASIDRLEAFKAFILRWTGPIILSVYTVPKGKPAVVKFIKENKFEKRIVTIVNTFTTPVNLFPINTLRNTGLKYVKTSHFIFLDVDTLPSSNLYEKLKSVSSAISTDSKQAIIVPAFFFSNQDEFTTVPFEEAYKKVIETVPAAMETLKGCMSKNECTTMSRYKKNHLYLPADFLDSSEELTDVTCFVNAEQEPYIMVRRDEAMPMLREKQKEYGMDRIMWILELSRKGYMFRILHNVFVFDIPHQFNVDVIKNDQSTINQKESTRELQVFVGQMKKYIPNNAVVKLCQ